MKNALLGWVAVCSIAGAAFANPAVAAGNKKLSKKELHDARVEIMSFAECSVGNHYEKAKLVMLANARNGEIEKDYNSLIDGSCLTPGMVAKFPADAFRYALADALVRKDYSQQGPADFSDRLPLAHREFPNQVELLKEQAKVKSPKKQKEMQDSFNLALAVAAFSRFGECIARTDPAGVRLWILTDPDGAEELSRIRALMPAFEKCTPTGTTLKFSRDMLRGAAALNYYRLANATVVPGAMAPTGASGTAPASAPAAAAAPPSTSESANGSMPANPAAPPAPSAPTPPPTKHPG